MKPNDNLFRLIKSLDKNEKGYFKKQAQSYSREKDQNYMKLFDAIDSQEDYNEEALLKKFRNEPFAKQFSVAKSYLWELLLKTQRNYRAGTSKFMRLNALMENGEVLFEKGLYEEAAKMWEKANELATAYDEKAFMLDIEAWKRRYYVDLRADLWDENVIPSFHRTEKLIDDISGTFEIQKIYFQIAKFIKTQPYFRTEEQKQEWEKILDQPILFHENEPADFYGKLYFNCIHSTFHNLSGHGKENQFYQKKIIELWESNPALIEVEPIRYIAAVSNYLGSLSKFGNNEEFISFVEQFEPPQLHSISQKAIYFEHWWMWKEITFRLRVDMEGFGKFIDETNEDILRYKPFINKVRWMLIRFETANYYFSVNQIPSALEILDELMDTKDIDLRKDIQAHVRLLYLVAHYELENNLILESISRSAKRYLQQKDFYYTTERIFLKHFNKLIYSADKKETQQIIHAMLEEIESQLAGNEKERQAFANFNLTNWIRAKAKGISISEVIKQEMQENQI